MEVNGLGLGWGLPIEQIYFGKPAKVGLPPECGAHNGITGPWYQELDFSIDFGTEVELAGVKCDWSGLPYTVYTSHDGRAWKKRYSGLHGDSCFPAPVKARHARVAWASTRGCQGLHCQFFAKRTPTAPQLEAMDRQVQRIRADSALSRQRLGLAGMLSPDEIIAELQSRCGPVGAVAPGAPLSTDQISGDYRLNNCCGLGGGASMTVVPVGPEAIEVWTSNSAFCPCLGCFLWQTQGAIMARDAHHFNSFAGIVFSDKGALPPPPGSFVPKVKARRAFRKVKAQDLAGIWCGCNMCGPFIPLWPLSFFPCTKITALDEDNYRTVESGCCLCLPMPPVHSEYRRIYVNGHPTNGFDTYLDGHPANMVDMAEREAAVSAGQARVTYYRDAGCSQGTPGMKRIC